MKLNPVIACVCRELPFISSSLILLKIRDLRMTLAHEKGMCGAEPYLHTQPDLVHQTTYQVTVISPAQATPSLTIYAQGRLRKIRESKALQRLSNRGVT